MPSAGITFPTNQPGSIKKVNCHGIESLADRTEHLKRIVHALCCLATVILISLAPGSATVYGQEREAVSWKVSFEGNDSFSGMVLGDIIATTQPSFFQKLLRRTGDYLLSETEVRRDVVRISNFYQRRGFDQVTITYRFEEGNKPWKQHVIFEIREGVPLVISNLEIIFEAPEEDEELIRSTRRFERAGERHHYQVGNRYQTVRQPDVEALFMQTMEEAGYAYADIEFETAIDSTAREVSVQIINIPGPRQRYGSFNVVGDLSVDESLVIRETGIDIGDYYSQSSIQRAQRELFNHHLFRFVTVSIPDEPADSTLELTLRVREHPQRSVQVGVGFGREELLRGQVTWMHRNVRQVGHRFSASARASFIEQQLSFDYLLPYVFNTQSSFITAPFGQHLIEPAFELFQAGITNTLIYQHDRTLTGSISYDLNYTSELTGVSATTLPDTVVNYNSAALTIGGLYNSNERRDSEGWLIQPYLELSSLFGEGTYTYQRAAIDVRRYTPLTRSLNLATRVQTGGLFAPEADQLPSAVRFFAGGTNSVRGWNRQGLGPKVAVLNVDGDLVRYVPVGGRAQLVFNVELRQDLDFLFPGFGMAAFLDGGQVWRSLRAMDERPIQFGGGGGLRYNSPIGPLRIDIGYKINPLEEDLHRYEDQDRGSVWNRLGIHFSIGQAF